MEKNELVLRDSTGWDHTIITHKKIGRFTLSPGAQRAKQTAIQRFQSQLRDRPGGAIVPRHVLEYFARPYEMFVL